MAGVHGRPCSGTVGTMTFRLPAALQQPDDDAALALLTRYFGRPYLAIGCAEGANFDTWVPGSDPDRFTSDDLIAIKFLSVEAPPAAVRTLLRDGSEQFSRLLVDLGPDRDLVDEQQPLSGAWPGWRLMGSFARFLESLRQPPPSCSPANDPDCGRSGTASSRASPTRSRCNGNRCARPFALTTAPFMTDYCDYETRQVYLNR
jgi:hypothetical protein